MPVHCKPCPSSSGQNAAVRAVHAAAIGIDVHANMLVASLQRCELGTARLEMSEARVEPTTRRELSEFVETCLKFKPEVIVMESTGVYWLSLYGLLEEAGFRSSQIHVLNARDVKPLRGRKTDEGDARRLCEIARMGTSRPSFIPARRFRELRALSRAMRNAARMARITLQRVHKEPSSLGCRASAVFSDLRGRAASRIVKALVDDGLSGEALLEFIKANCGKLKHSPEEIYEALDADMKSPVWESVRSSMRMMRCAEAEEEKLYARIKELLSPYSRQLELLQTLPGVKEKAAVQILCEIGDDLSSFGNSRQFASWAGVSPGNNEPAGRRTSGRVTKGNKHLRATLVECANAISLMKGKGGKVGQYFQALKERRGHLRAVIATAHKLVRIIFAMFRDDAPYQDDPNCQTLRKHRVERLRAAAEGVAEVDLGINGDIVLTDESGATYGTVRTEVRRKRRAEPIS